MEDNKYMIELLSARDGKIIRNLIIALVTVVILFFGTIIGGLVYLSECYDIGIVTDGNDITVDGKNGVANYIGQDGDITNGEDHGTQIHENSNANEENK